MLIQYILLSLNINQFAYLLSTENMNIVMTTPQNCIDMLKNHQNSRIVNNSITLRNIDYDGKNLRISNRINVGDNLVLWKAGNEEYICLEILNLDFCNSDRFKYSIYKCTLQDIKKNKDRFKNIRFSGLGLSAESVEIPYMSDRDKKMLRCIKYNDLSTLLQYPRLHLEMDPFTDEIVFSGIVEYINTNNELIIPDFVDKIYEHSRINTDRYNIQSITLGSNIKKLPNCFNSNSSIKEIIINSNSITLENEALYNCRSLNTVIGAESITSIGKFAFGVSGIKYFCAGSKLCKIDKNAFFNSLIQCADLSKSSITELPTETFCNCRLLHKIILPKTIKKIYLSAFPSHIKPEEVLILNKNYEVENDLLSVEQNGKLYDALINKKMPC